MYTNTLHVDIDRIRIFPIRISIKLDLLCDDISDDHQQARTDSVGDQQIFAKQMAKKTFCRRRLVAGQVATSWWWYPNFLHDGE